MSTPGLLPAEALAALESMRADASRARAAAEQVAQTVNQQGPTVAQGIQRGGTGIQQVGQNAPAIAQGIQRGGTGIQQAGTGLSQTGLSIQNAMGDLRNAGQSAGQWFFTAATVFLGAAIGATVLAVIALATRKENRRPARRRRRR